MTQWLSLRRSNLAKFAAPWLLATVATVQVFTALQTPLTPWKCGGFGMFSDIQQPANRSVLAWVRIDGKLSPARIPPWLDRQKKTVQAMPTEDNLSKLVDILSRLDWGNSDGKSPATGDLEMELPEDARANILVGIAFEVRYSTDMATGKRQIYSEPLCRVTQTLQPVEVER